MGLKRKFYDFLVNWKKQKHLECLLVNGARQIGKTYINRPSAGAPTGQHAGLAITSSVM